MKTSTAARDPCRFSFGTPNRRGSRYCAGERRRGRIHRTARRTPNAPQEEIPVIPYSVTFGGISGRYASWKDATFVVIPFPVDITTTYMAGTRNGPRAILDASSHMELFDEENKIETYRAGIFVSTEAPVALTAPVSALQKTEEVKTFYASEVRDNVADVTKGIVSSMSGNVYITIDLDVFDPGIMPAVVTPHPPALIC